MAVCAPEHVPNTALSFD